VDLEFDSWQEQEFFFSSPKGADRLLWSGSALYLYHQRLRVSTVTSGTSRCPTVLRTFYVDSVVLFSDILINFRLHCNAIAGEAYVYFVMSSSIE